MRPLSILHMANHCDVGGNVHLAVDLACAQADRGHRVAFASAGGRCEALLARHGVRHLTLEQSLRRPLGAARALRGLLAACRELRPDVLHAHMMSAAILGRAAATLRGVPLVTTVHNSFDRHASLMRLGDVAVAVSTAERDLLLRRGFPARRLRVVVNGTIGSARDAGTDAPPAPPGLPRPRIVTMSGLERRKGVHDVIEAFRRIAAAAPGWHLVVAGAGPERENLERQAAASGVGDRIRFVGHVDGTRALLAETDIFVLASLAEPFGLGILEARRAGCAVVATRVGGIVEQLGEDDRHGRLVPPSDPGALAAALAVLVTDTAALATARAAAGQELGRYKVDRMAEDYLAICRELIRIRVPGHADARCGAGGHSAPIPPAHPPSA